MNRKPCRHGVQLERGLRCDHGYIQVRLEHIGVIKNFGPHTKDSEAVAKIYLAERRREILLGKAGIKPEAPRKRFDDVLKLHGPLWAAETDGDGRPKHNAYSIHVYNRIVRGAIRPTFKDRWFDEIRPIEINNWREMLIRDRSISGTTVNRYQNVLSGIFTDTIKWIKAEKLRPAFRLPAENPCHSADKAEMKKRERVFSEYELKKLKLAFATLGDNDGWEICKLALKSVLSLSDLKALEVGQVIDTERTKTGVPIRLPVTVLTKLNFTNWRYRWAAAVKKAGLEDAQFRDLRKTGINALTGKGFDQKLVSQFAGHASTRTTESVYQLRQSEKLKPLADTQEQWVEGI